MQELKTNDESKPVRGMPPHHWIDEKWLSLRSEDVIDPDLPIVDPHLHLWNHHGSYLIPQVLEDINSGHHVRGTVFVECSFMYRRDGDPRFASVGEVEYINGIAAEFASGCHGHARVCAGIVGKVDLTMGALAGEVMDECIARAPDRFRGIRHMAAWDASPQVNTLRQPPPKDLLMDPRFREGFAQLGPRKLVFDLWCYHPQLHQAIDLADAFPDTQIVIDHLGGRVGTGPYAPVRDAVTREWRASIQELARRPNVRVKLGGIGMRLGGFDFVDRDLPPTSAELADAWAPFVETCIDAFGPDRSMFESNFPPDKACCSYRVLWNTFKRITAGYSESERSDMFAKTAIRTYRLPEELGRTAG
ncbi:amidohydrolase family protein [Burkholderia pseudomultivorans]|nr:amidohydrolase family protein [Burkholderia pseudomultivorans]